MTTIPSPFGAPAEPPQAVEPEAPTSGRPSTVLMAVGAGVVALGILGGAAALVLAPGEDAAAPAVPAAAPVVTPTTDAVDEPQQPLPTAVSRGRNVFVPLIAAATGDEAAADDPSAGPVDDGAVAGDTPVAPVIPITSVGGGTSVGGARSTVISPSSSTELQAAKDQITLLQSQLQQLQSQLATASDDSALEQQIATLTSQKDSLTLLVGSLQEKVDQQEKTEASRLLLDVLGADGTTLTVRVAGTDYPVAVGSTVQVASTSAGVPLSVTYLSFTDVADPGPDEVRLTYVNATYSASVGATLVLPR